MTQQPFCWPRYPDACTLRPAQGAQRLTLHQRDAQNCAEPHPHCNRLQVEPTGSQTDNVSFLPQSSKVNLFATGAGAPATLIAQQSAAGVLASLQTPSTWSTQPPGKSRHSSRTPTRTARTASSTNRRNHVFAAIKSTPPTSTCPTTATNPTNRIPSS